MVVSRLSLSNSGAMDREVTTKSNESYSAMLAQRLRLLRAQTGLSQEAVAHRAGLSAYTYQKFEKGESKPGTPMNPRLYTLISLADVFEVDVADLLRFDREP